MFSEQKKVEQKSKPKKEFDEKSLRHKAIELLARREYSYAELEKKLLVLSEDDITIHKILDWLIEMELQSDARFTQMFLRSKALSGYGPVRIKLELKQKGINEYLIESSFEALAFDWDEEVDRLVQKKVKEQSLDDMKLKNKVLGYLQRRGFTLDQIHSGFNRINKEV